MPQCPSCEAGMTPVFDEGEELTGDPAKDPIVGWRCTNKDCGYFEEVR